MPRAMAAHARVSASSRRPSSPRGIRILSSTPHAGRPRQGAVGFEERHLLGQIGLPQLAAGHRRFDPLERAAVTATAQEPDRRHPDVPIRDPPPPPRASAAPSGSRSRSARPPPPASSRGRRSPSSRPIPSGAAASRSRPAKPHHLERGRRHPGWRAPSAPRPGFCVARRSAERLTSVFTCSFASRATQPGQGDQRLRLQLLEQLAQLLFARDAPSLRRATAAAATALRAGRAGRESLASAIRCSGMSSWPRCSTSRSSRST